MKQLIEVTQEHIDKGRVHDGFRCPVAAAVKEATGEKWQVAPLWLRPARGGPTVWAPRSVVAFVRRFDRGEPVKPFRFWFEA